MARTPRETSTTPDSTVNQEDSTVTATATETPVQVEPTVPAPSETPTETPEPDVDLTPFTSALQTAIDGRDQSTGDLPLDMLQAVKSAYTSLPAKGKTQARNTVKASALDAMRALNAGLARAYVNVQDALAAPTPAAPREPKAPVDPTESDANRLAAVRLAASLVSGQVSEAAIDASNTLTANLDQAVTAAYGDWLASTAEDKGEAPSVPAFVEAAYKIVSGRAVRAPKVSTGSTATRTVTYTGPRRSVAAHIEQVFADQPAGTFLKIGAIAGTHSAEYGDDLPSSGAISARLASTKPLQGVRAETQSGVAGAVKI
jgi:hypothetical protein